jgi:hypothetical protein
MLPAAVGKKGTLGFLAGGIPGMLLATAGKSKDSKSESQAAAAKGQSKPAAAGSGGVGQ